jgi:NAD(P) transhydrogenase subunit alpha
MRIGVVAESAPGESRVAATPLSVARLVGLGYDVVVERGAGRAASFTDEAYAQSGAKVGEMLDAWSCDVVLKVEPPITAEVGRLLDGAVLIGMVGPGQRPELLTELCGRNLTVLAIDAVPRISRTQSMDALSSMANIAGYRAVIEAAHEFGRFFTGQVTAAGKVPPARVLVAGAGVAGLAAIGTASSLGAVVRATDPRPEVADQVRSVGGQYLAVEVHQESSSDGYARVTSEEYDRRAAQIYTEQAAQTDIIITTALVPGRPAPRLLTAEDVALMRPGSVVVDMAAAQGGNVAGSVPGQRVVTPNGVAILGYTDLPSRLPTQASQMYATNVVNLVALLTPGQDGQLQLDLDDVVHRAITVARGGVILWPPPPVSVSAAPASAIPTPATPAVAEVPVPKRNAAGRRGVLAALGALALCLVHATAPAPLPQHITVLVLSVIIGYYVIGKVHHALHTPLMSVTNAVSGIIVVGAALQLTASHPFVRALAALAVLLASINIVGGFAVTRRMLGMFSKE